MNKLLEIIKLADDILKNEIDISPDVKDAINDFLESAGVREEAAWLQEKEDWVKARNLSLDRQTTKGE
jgi:hypothetical protein